MISCSRLIAFGIAVLLCISCSPRTAQASDEFDMATRLAMLGDYKGALKEYEKFLYNHPEDPQAPTAAMAAGNLYLDSLDDPDAAVWKFDVVIMDYRSSSWSPEAAARKGAALHGKEEWRPAAEAYELALELDAEQGKVQSADWTNDVVSNAADCYHQLDDHQNVLATYRRALEGSPPPEVTATALFRMGEAYEAMEQPAEAARRYAEVLEKAPCASGQIFAQTLAKRELIETHTLLDLAPYTAYNESYQLMGQREYKAALERCREGEAATTSAPLLECLEGRRIYIEGSLSADFGTGLRNMEAYLEKYPDGQTSYFAGRVVAFWQMIVGAEEEVAKNPDSPDHLSGLGVLYFYAGSYAPTIEIMERVQELDPENRGSYELLGMAYFHTDRTEEAVRQFDLLMEKGEPEDNNTYTVAGTACMTAKQYDKAVRYFERMVELSAEDPTAHSNLADALWQAGRLGDAEAACRKALELDPNSSSSMFILGKVHQGRDETDEAILHFEQFLEIVPEGEHADEAREALEELRG